MSDKVPSKAAIEFVEKMVKTDIGGYWQEYDLRTLFVEFPHPDHPNTDIKQEVVITDALVSVAYEDDEFAKTKRALALLLDAYLAEHKSSEFQRELAEVKAEHAAMKKRMTF